MRIRGIHAQFHGTRGTNRESIWDEGFGAKARKAKASARDIRKCGLEIVPTHGICRCIDPVQGQVIATDTTEVWATSQSPAFVPAQRTLDQIAAEQDSSEISCMQRVTDELLKAGINPEKATRRDVQKVTDRLRSKYGRALAAV